MSETTTDSEPTFTLNQLEKAYWQAVNVYDENVTCDIDELNSHLSKGFEEFRTEILKEIKQ